MPVPSIGIDYDASVPMDQRAPFTVVADPDKPPGKHRADFVPSPHKAREMAETPDRVAPDEPHHRKVHIQPGVNFMSRADSDKRIEKQKSVIMKRAKAIFRSKREHLEDFHQAEKLLTNLTENQKKNPTEAMIRARKIVKRGCPITKQKAVELARREFLGQERERN